MVVEREDYDGFVAAMGNPSEWIPKSWSSDDDMGDIIYGGSTKQGLDPGPIPTLVRTLSEKTAS
jgi:hypothetical protein